VRVEKMFCCIGNVDVGKTTFIQMITHRVCDTLEEEKKTKSTNTMCEGFFEIIHDTKYITLVDVPGHKSLLRSMISGVSLADTIILIVSCVDNEFRKGIDGQTKEHLRIIYGLGIRKIIVVFNKRDLVAKDPIHLENRLRQILKNIEVLKVFYVSCIEQQSRQLILDFIISIPTKTRDYDFVSFDMVDSSLIGRCFSVLKVNSVLWSNVTGSLKTIKRLKDYDGNNIEESISGNMVLVQFNEPMNEKCDIFAKEIIANKSDETIDCTVVNVNKGILFSVGLKGVMYSGTINCDFEVMKIKCGNILRYSQNSEIQLKINNFVYESNILLRSIDNETIGYGTILK
jgi:signal recognition particle receptor subunit beta